MRISRKVPEGSAAFAKHAGRAAEGTQRSNREVAQPKRTRGCDGPSLGDFNLMLREHVSRLRKGEGRAERGKSRTIVSARKEKKSPILIL